MSKFLLKDQPFTVLVEGNIGAGKTTFLNHFRKFDDICLHTEPVDKWRNVQGVNLLVSVENIVRMTVLNCLHFCNRI